jgi:hypothetical protein
LLLDDVALKELVQLRLARNYKEIEAKLRRCIRFVKFGGKARSN